MTQGTHRDMEHPPYGRMDEAWVGTFVGCPGTKEAGQPGGTSLMGGGQDDRGRSEAGCCSTKSPLPVT